MASTPQTWTYPGITEAQLQALAAELGQPYSSSGEATTHGVNLSWQYDPATQTLEVTAHNESWPATFDRIKRRLDGMLTPPQRT